MSKKSRVGGDCKLFHFTVIITATTNQNLFI